MSSRRARRDGNALVAFPFDDLSAGKVRPAVCLTEPLGPYRHVVLAFISSKCTDDLLPSDLALKPSDAGFIATGLRVASTLRLHRVMTVSLDIVRRELGVLSPAMVAAVREKLQALFLQ